MELVLQYIIKLLNSAISVFHLKYHHQCFVVIILVEEVMNQNFPKLP